MRAEIVDRPNGEPNVEVEATPVCGEDFCDRCGDCLACYSSDPCYGGAEVRPDHRWVVYADLSPERTAVLLAPASPRAGGPTRHQESSDA